MVSREEKNKFSMMIMQRALDSKTDHMDAITSYCEENDLEVEVAATLINEPLKSLIQCEAMDLRQLPRTGTLSF
jgi:hypothetical protein